MALFTVDREKPILDMFVKNDPHAMESLYNEYSTYLAGVCYRYVCDDAIMKDVLQDSFIRIFSSIGQFDYRGKGSLKAWMTRIVINESLQELRRSSKTKPSSQSTAISEDGAELSAPATFVTEPDEEDLDVSNITVEQIIELTSQLPEGYRTVLNMFLFDQMSHKEIAEALGIKESTSASQFFKARKMLASLIRNRYNIKR